MIEDDIRTYLLTQSPITTLVGTDASGSMARIYAISRQQGITADSISMRRVGTNHVHNLIGGAGFGTAVIEFDCVSLTYSGAKTLGNTLRGELQGYAGTMGSATISSVILDDEQDEFDEAIDASQKGQFHCIQMYSFLFAETVPSF